MLEKSLKNKRPEKQAARCVIMSQAVGFWRCPEMPDLTQIAAGFFVQALPGWRLGLIYCHPQSPY
jgi:hypothetical protein